MTVRFYDARFAGLFRPTPACDGGFFDARCAGLFRPTRVTRNFASLCARHVPRQERPHQIRDNITFVFQREVPGIQKMQFCFR
jgi:hypothetical protein